MLNFALIFFLHKKSVQSKAISIVSKYPKHPIKVLTYSTISLSNAYLHEAAFSCTNCEQARVSQQFFLHPCHVTLPATQQKYTRASTTRLCIYCLLLHGIYLPMEHTCSHALTCRQGAKHWQTNRISCKLFLKLLFFILRIFLVLVCRHIEAI